MSNPADAQLLFGLLALQNGLIDQARLVAAFQAWTLDRSKSLADYLKSPGSLTDSDCALIEAIVDHHRKKHGDTENSLASITLGQATIDALAPITELEATLSHVGRSATGPVRTGTDQLGAAASVGQRFRVLRPHARGGLGAVYVALDSELNREVALKQILANHADNPVLRGRFLVEAEITGGLEHPGIVPVYGLGKYDDGRPYYAMRFILGKTLKETVDQFRQDRKSESERSLNFRRLLKNFTDVCHAIDYAHSRGVLHRDIKPGNVIVGNHGETLVVDWGLAKALGQSAPDAVERTLIPSSGDGSSETLPGQALGTPAYMSPEQARGDLEKLGPRSDVYSLGATLDYLLTGQAPFGGHPQAILKAVEAGDFKRPRDRDPSIDPALEAIALKAMAKEPSARYDSAEALANEIDRWLADERVEAYPEPWTRSLIRWLTRHRTGVTSLAAAGLVALIGLGIVSTVQTRARRDLDARNALLDTKNTELTKANTDLEESNRALDLQRNRAEANESQAIDAVKRFTDAITNNAELKDNPSLKSLRKTLLQEPLTFFGKLRERLQADNDTRPGSLSRLSEVAFAHALLVNEIGDKQDAISVYLQALAIDERLARDHPDVAQSQANLAAGLANLGILLTDSGRNEEARSALERARAIYDQLVRDHPDVAIYQANLAASHNHLGTLLRDVGRGDEAQAACERAVAILDRLTHDHPDVAQYQADLAGSQINLGNLLRAAGQNEEARAAFVRSLEIRERLARDHPDVAKYQTDLAASCNSYGALLYTTRRTEEARPTLERALEIDERLAREQPDVPDHASDAGGALNNLAAIDLIAGHPAEARERILRAVDWQKKALSANPRNPQYRQFFEKQLGILLQAERALGHEAEAAQAERELTEFRLHDPKYEPLDARLKTVREGDPPKDTAERLAMAQRAYDTRQFQLAARLWGEALDADPGLAESRNPQHRYNAACAATLAVNGLGDDPAGDDTEKTRLRVKALGWLQADLTLWSKLLESAPPQVKPAIAQILQHWQKDADLDSVRDPEALARLPEAEQAAWKTLWEGVAELLRKLE